MPTDEAWKTLVRRYANGRCLCNCREAYRGSDGMCPHGCSANKLTVRDEIAEHILEVYETLGHVIKVLPL